MALQVEDRSEHWSVHRPVTVGSFGDHRVQKRSDVVQIAFRLVELHSGRDVLFAQRAAEDKPLRLLLIRNRAVGQRSWRCPWRTGINFDLMQSGIGMVFAPCVAEPDAEPVGLDRTEINHGVDVSRAFHHCERNGACPIRNGPGIHLKIFQGEAVPENGREQHETLRGQWLVELNHDVRRLKAKRMRFSDPFGFRVAIDGIFDFELVPRRRVRSENSRMPRKVDFNCLGFPSVLREEIR